MRGAWCAFAATLLTIGILATPTASADTVDRQGSPQAVPSWGPAVQVPSGLKRNFEHAVKQCGYFLQYCPYGSYGERSLYAAGRDIMCSQSRSPFKHSYPSLSIRTPRKSWATMLVQFKLSWPQRVSGERVTVAVDGRFGPLTESAWLNEARYAPITADGTVSGKSDWIWVFMFYCGD